MLVNLKHHPAGSASVALVEVELSRGRFGPSVCALKTIRVVEIGDRIAAGACGALLAGFGAEVVLIESPGEVTCHKWGNRPIIAAGKKCIRAGLGEEVARRLLESADVVIASTDVALVPPYARPTNQIVCDITAYGGVGPLAGEPHSDALIQAVTGLIETTGEDGVAPQAINFPIVEAMGAAFAAAGIQAALRTRARDGLGQDVKVALYDCAFSTLTPFQSLYFGDQPIPRSGNGHVLVVPWNAYKAADGWLILCTTTDDQWQRLCTIIEATGLAQDHRFANLGSRVIHRDHIDKAIADWTAKLPVAECVERLQVNDIACGPVISIADSTEESNIKHRGSFATTPDPVTGRKVIVSNTVMRFERQPLAPAVAIPKLDQHRAELLATKHRDVASPDMPGSATKPAPPLAGLKILEIGQYTTGPLATRYLAALGAEVIKIEPPAGDSARGLRPKKHGESFFFVLTNTGKRSLVLDLRKDEDQCVFKSLIEGADVLIENLKPGSLDRLGLGAASLQKINPRLICCSVSGFGAYSVYPGRAAFDTVIQAMSGIMDLNSIGGIPQKTGISMADITGGLFGMIGILHAILQRDAGGPADIIDISMQDVAAWIAHWRARGIHEGAAAQTLACRDGHVIVEAEELSADVIANLLDLSRVEAVVHLRGQGLSVAPILSVPEAMESEQTAARGILVQCKDDEGISWSVVGCPFNLSRTPPLVDRLTGPLGSANSDIRSRGWRS